MTGNKRLPLDRRRFLGAAAAGLGAMALPGCSDTPEPGRYTAQDIQKLAQQRATEAQSAGQGPYGVQVFSGYRGLADLPWFELDDSGMLHCVGETVPHSIDVHAHLGMSVLFRPKLDLQATAPRVRHLLDCDATDPGCNLDLDIYINGNFTEEALSELRLNTIAQGLWGSPFAVTQTIPGLLTEMDAMRVDRSFILPIKLGLPFGDSQTEHWADEIVRAGAGSRLIAGLSVHPRSSDSIAEMQRHAASGARLLKLHPTVQQFYPDDPQVMPLYEEAQRLGLVIFFHGGRAGIEPESRLRYAMPRHYEAVLADFPKLPVILGHAGARDSEDMVKIAQQYPNAWLGTHGQGVTRLHDIIRRTGGERLLFGSDWPFYHIGASLAKVLICTDHPGGDKLRTAILRDNALALFPELNSSTVA